MKVKTQFSFILRVKEAGFSGNDINGNQRMYYVTRKKVGEDMKMLVVRKEFHSFQELEERTVLDED